MLRVFAPEFRGGARRDRLSAVQLLGHLDVLDEQEARLTLQYFGARPRPTSNILGVNVTVMVPNIV